MKRTRQKSPLLLLQSQWSPPPCWTRICLSVTVLGCFIRQGFAFCKNLRVPGSLPMVLKELYTKTGFRIFWKWRLGWEGAALSLFANRLMNMLSWCTVCCLKDELRAHVSWYEQSASIDSLSVMMPYAILWVNGRYASSNCVLGCLSVEEHHFDLFTQVTLCAFVSMRLFWQANKPLYGGKRQIDRKSVV